MDKDNQFVPSPKCEICDKTFKTKSGLYKHTKTIHPTPELTLIQKMGRPTLYREEFADQLVNWFSGTKYEKVTMEKTTIYNSKTGKISRETEKYKYVAADLPTLEGFARSIGVSHDSLLTWATAVEDVEAEILVKKHPYFSVAYNTAKSLQKEFLIENGLKGHYPPASFIFVAKNITDMTDKQIIETKDQDYKEKKDALSDWFDTIRHNVTPEPEDSAPDTSTGSDIQE